MKIKCLFPEIMTCVSPLKKCCVWYRNANCNDCWTLWISGGLPHLDDFLTYLKGSASPVTPQFLPICIPAVLLAIFVLPKEMNAVARVL